MNFRRKEKLQEFPDFLTPWRRTITLGGLGFYWSNTVDPMDDDIAYYLYLGRRDAYNKRLVLYRGF